MRSTAGGVEPIGGGGGGGVVADGATIPRRVRLAMSGDDKRMFVEGGGGGGTLRVPGAGAGRDVPPFFPRPSKTSRSDPPFSFCAICTSLLPLTDSITGAFDGPSKVRCSYCLIFYRIANAGAPVAT